MLISDQQPDVRLLTRLGTALSGSDNIHLFIPGDSPFGYNVDRNWLRAIRASLSRSGVDKDHVLLLPMETFALRADRQRPPAGDADEDLLRLTCVSSDADGLW